MLESLGLTTTVIGLVRPHMEKSANPRGLFVPFPPGRPLGEPGDAAFQRRVLLAALGLLERADGPVILADFPADAPFQAGVPRWRPALVMPPPTSPASPYEWAAALAIEIALVRPSSAAAPCNPSTGVSHWRCASAHQPTAVKALTAGVKCRVNLTF